MNMLKRTFGRKLPIPSTVEIRRELIIFSAKEDAKRAASKAQDALKAAP